MRLDISKMTAPTDTSGVLNVNNSDIGDLNAMKPIAPVPDNRIEEVTLGSTWFDQETILKTKRKPRR
jgi:hypothetical protein